MNKEKYIDMVINQVLPATLKKVWRFATKIKFQMDSAGGHGGGRSSLKSKTLPELHARFKSFWNKRGRKIWRNLKRPCVEFIAQPAKSPDLNLLDLGIWNSPQTSVDSFFSTSECLG